jgi:hypothetical protein
MKSKYIPILGDALTLLIVTLIGFATHGESNLSFLPRILATFVPLLVAWFLIAYWFGLLTPTRPPLARHPVRANAKHLGDVPKAEGVLTAGLAMLFAGPLAIVLRGLILNAPIIPIFAVVLSVISALGMIVWRALYFLLSSKFR